MNYNSKVDGILIELKVLKKQFSNVDNYDDGIKIVNKIDKLERNLKITEVLKRIS